MRDQKTIRNWDHKVELQPNSAGYPNPVVGNGSVIRVDDQQTGCVPLFIHNEPVSIRMGIFSIHHYSE